LEDFKIRSVPLSELSDYHRPEEVTGYCKSCPKYGKFWSCPPHGFDVSGYIHQFQHACIIGVKVHLDPVQNRNDALAYYHHRRHLLNAALLEIEADLSTAEVLFSGNCDVCNTCSRKEGQPCIRKDKMRYSLESLGYNVSEISETLLGKKLQWDQGKMPEYLVLVAAILSNAVIDTGTIKLA